MAHQHIEEIEMEQFVYILKQIVDVDNSDGYWDHPSVTTRQDTVGATLSREYASKWFGLEIEPSTLIASYGRKSVTAVKLIS